MVFIWLAIERCQQESSKWWQVYSVLLARLSMDPLNRMRILEVKLVLSQKGKDQTYLEKPYFYFAFLFPLSFCTFHGAGDWTEPLTSVRHVFYHGACSFQSCELMSLKMYSFRGFPSGPQGYSNTSGEYLRMCSEGNWATPIVPGSMKVASVIMGESGGAKNWIWVGTGWNTLLLLCNLLAPRDSTHIFFLVICFEVTKLRSYTYPYAQDSFLAELGESYVVSGIRLSQPSKRQILYCCIIDSGSKTTSLRDPGWVTQFDDLKIISNWFKWEIDNDTWLQIWGLLNGNNGLCINKLIKPTLCYNSRTLLYFLLPLHQHQSINPSKGSCTEGGLARQPVNHYKGFF